MLINDFFTIQKHEVAMGGIQASIVINKAHEIFAGHFPGLPIVPGVCMMQMVKEVVEFSHKKKYNIDTAENVKFLSVINPTEYDVVEMNIVYTNGKDNAIAVEASIFSGSTIFFKLKATMKSL
jgi:3-hydroxyacyl-[acyl-carrier-protein] dehydratase